MPAKKYIDDDDILKMLSADDEQAINALYSRHHKQIFNVINSIIHDTESSKDLVQDLFFAIWERRHTLQIKKPIVGYLCRSAVNRAINYKRDNKRHSMVHIELQHVLEKEAACGASENSIEINELRELIDSAILTMPSSSKVAFLLSREQHLTHQEIATELNITKKAVEKRISISIKHLQSVLHPYLKGLLMLLML